MGGEVLAASSDEVVGRVEKAVGAGGKVRFQIAEPGAVQAVSRGEQVEAFDLRPVEEIGQRHVGRHGFGAVGMKMEIGGELHGGAVNSVREGGAQRVDMKKRAGVSQRAWRSGVFSEALTG